MVEKRAAVGELVFEHWLGSSGTSVIAEGEGKAGCACSAHLLTCQRLRIRNKQNTYLEVILIPPLQ